MHTIRYYPYEAGRTLYPIDFTLGFLSREHIYVYVGDDPNTQVSYSWVNDGQISLSAPILVGEELKIQRIVPRTPFNDYENGARLSHNNLDKSFAQAIMLHEEVLDGFLGTEFVLQSDKLTVEELEVINSINANEIILGSTTTNPDGATKLSQVVEIASQAQGANFVSETAPDVPFNGLRWYVPSLATTFVWYVDVDGGQWVEEAVQYAEGTLRTELAGAASPVLVGGVQASKIAKGLTVVAAKSVGLLGDSSDDTAAWVAAEANLVDGDTFVFHDGTYKGTFRTKKAINFIFRNAKLTNATAGDGILQIGPELADFDTYAVTEDTVAYKATSFTIPVSNNVQAGDIGYLWDGSTRPGDGQPVNFEVVKVKSIASGVVTIYDHINAHFSGSITFNHSTIQPKNVTVEGFKAEPDNTHLEFALRFIGVENVTLRKHYTTNTVGNAASVRYCYNADIETVTTNKPRLATSGQGYGVALFAVTKVKAHHIVGHGCRHVLDADSVYGFDYRDIHETDDQSAPVIIGHNGFCGNGTLEGVHCLTSQYAVSTSNQGFGAGANKADHPLRNVKIRDINTAIKADVTPDTNIAHVYIRNNVDNVEIDGVNVRYLNASALTSAAQSSVVRIDGIAVGKYSAKNLSADRIGRFHYSNGDRQGAVYKDYVSDITNMSAEVVNQPVLHTGTWALHVDDISFDNCVGNKLIVMNATGGDTPQYLSVGGDIHYAGPNVQIYEVSSNITGRVEQLGRSVSASVSVTDGYAVTASDVQNRGDYVRLVAPIGAGTATMSDFPSPYVNGQKITIRGWLSDRQNVLIPVGLASMFEDVLFDATNPTRTLVAISGLWRIA